MTHAPRGVLHGEGGRGILDFRLHWAPSYDEEGRDLTARTALEETRTFWLDWSRPARPDVARRVGSSCVQRSLITLKALTYAPTGGIVAAPTTSLPEDVGGIRNWDYRFCWVRDATLTLDGLVESGHLDEARAWFRWLLRAAAGNPDQLQIMYGVAGERRLPELELDWLPGYEGSTPVRVGNAASLQFQLDVFGELMEAIDMARGQGIEPRPSVWDLQRVLLEFVEGHWDEPDQGIWELQGPPQTARVLPGHGLGGDGQGGQSDREVPARRPGRALAQSARHHSRAGVHPGLQRQGRSLHPGLWV